MPKKKDTPQNIKCSFCGKSQDAVKRIIAGPGVYICNECIDVCKNIVEEGYEDDEEIKYTLDDEYYLPSPAEIKDILDFTANDFTLVNYDPHPGIKGAVAI